MSMAAGATAASCASPRPPQDAVEEGSPGTCEMQAHADLSRGSESSSSSTKTVDHDEDVDGDTHDAQRRAQLAYAIEALKLYNPDFHLTPDVLAIMRAFFDDLDPERRGYVSLRALFDEIARLDPQKELVSEDTRAIMGREMQRHTRAGGAEQGDERDGEQATIDFEAFCMWVMRWKEISPLSVQRIYTSWAKEIAVMDYGLSEGDGMFITRNELPRIPPPRVGADELSRLLRNRRRRQQRAIEEQAMSSNAAGRQGGNRSLAMKRRRSPGDDETARNEEMRGAELSPSANAVPADLCSSPAFNPQSVVSRGDSTAVGMEQEGEALDDECALAEATEEDEKHIRSRSADSVMTVSKSFIAGGLAGIAAKSALAPVDRVKIMFQVNEHRAFSFRNAYNLAREIYVQDGFRALFRGNMLNILRVVPYAGVQHSSFDYFRRRFHAYNYAQAEKHGFSYTRSEMTKLSNLQLISAGSLAGGLSLVMAYPIDIVRARYMVQQGKGQTNLIDAVRSMYRLEGARSFSRGLVPSLLGTLPYTGIGFTLNERFKFWMRELLHGRSDPSEDIATQAQLHPFAKFLCSYLAACIAQTCTYPMDTIRRRIQTDGFVSGPGAGREGAKGAVQLRYTGVVTTARIIMAHEGWRGFFKGVSVNWMRSPLATGISLTAYDVLKEVMGVERVG